MEQVWDHGLEIAMPTHDDVPVPPKPPGFERSTSKGAGRVGAGRPEARSVDGRGPPHPRAERRDAGQAHRTSRRYSPLPELRDEPVIYFPHQLDFRGRAYAVPVGLQPQGNDHAGAADVRARQADQHTARCGLADDPRR
jgi:DNA-directed RNA polymerase